MLSRARIVAPHPRHAERGTTIDFFRGTRWMTTVRNEPNMSPAPAKATPRITDTPKSLRGSLWDSGYLYLFVISRRKATSTLYPVRLNPGTRMGK